MVTITKLFKYRHHPRNKMITELDESLLHQGPETFCHALVSDHRFFDRTVFGLQAPEGDIALIASMGVYKNTNVMDGFAMVQNGSGRQFNHRFSRTLFPDYSNLVLGPLSISVLEPLKRVRLQLKPGSYASSFDIEWTAVLAPHEEARHTTRVDGRMVRDHMRFDQFGCANGWIEIEGRRTEVENWFTWRDHSWGVRPGVGGFEPYTGSRESDSGHLGIYVWWLTEEAGCLLQIQENGEGERQYLDGKIYFRDGRTAVSIADASHDYTLIEGTRLFQTGNLRLVDCEGGEWHVELASVGRAWAYKGSGYDHGFADEMGLGVWRGQWLEEHDIYDTSHPENVVLPGGRNIRPVHREQFSRVRVNGNPGFAHTPFISAGTVHRYGLVGDAEDLPG
jgi:hypothetical protein